MSTYLIRDDEGNAHVTEFGKPTPAHALTKSAKAARRSVRDMPPVRVVYDVIDDKYVMTRAKTTRAEVEAAYVPPAPEVPAREVLWGELKAQGARSLHALGDGGRHHVKATYNRGTTLPKWHVNSPDNKTNPGPPVDASQYHGEVVDVETVYVRTNILTHGAPCKDIRGVWLNGKLDRIQVDGVETTLRAAREVLS